MSAPDRTFSFRANGELEARMDKAALLLRRAATEPETGLADLIGRELALSLLREPSRLDTRTHSAFIRGMIELVVSTAEKVAYDERMTAEYAELRKSMTPDEREFLEAARRVAARRWRDD